MIDLASIAIGGFLGFALGLALTAYVAKELTK